MKTILSDVEIADLNLYKQNLENFSLNDEIRTFNLFKRILSFDKKNLRLFLSFLGFEQNKINDFLEENPSVFPLYDDVYDGFFNGSVIILGKTFKITLYNEIYFYWEDLNKESFNKYLNKKMDRPETYFYKLKLSLSKNKGDILLIDLCNFLENLLTIAQNDYLISAIKKYSDFIRFTYLYYFEIQNIYFKLFLNKFPVPKEEMRNVILDKYIFFRDSLYFYFINKGFFPDYGSSSFKNQDKYLKIDGYRTPEHFMSYLNIKKRDYDTEKSIPVFGSIDEYQKIAFQDPDNMLKFLYNFLDEKLEL